MKPGKLAKQQGKHTAKPSNLYQLDDKMGGHIRHLPALSVVEEFRATIMAPFGLLAAHEFHEFGLRLAPVLVSMVAVPAARLIDLVSAGPYLFLREGARRIFLEGFLLSERVRFLANFSFRIKHSNSYACHN